MIESNDKIELLVSHINRLQCLNTLNNIIEMP